MDKYSQAYLSPLYFEYSTTNGYIIPIDDLQSLEMANSVEGFKFFISEHHVKN